MRPTHPLPIAGLFLLALGACMAAHPIGEVPRAGASAFEDEIRAYENADRLYPPPGGAVVFAGSSSIRRWHSLESDMRPLDVLNRGYGGARYADLLPYLDRIVVPYAPSAVVLYAGDNDMAGDSAISPDQLLRDVRRVLARIRVRVPEAKVYVLSIKPSPSRWQQWPAMQQANELVAAMLAERSGAYFVDVASPMLDAAGQPRSELYDEDRLHLSEAGYAVWTAALRRAMALDESSE